jgi:hypothetical protein
MASSQSGEAWWVYREHVTVSDVLDSGACLDGVKEWVAKHRGRIAGPAGRYPKQGEIQKATHGDGSGYGYGYGYGYGDGDGYGSGDGSGYGYGYGYGDGYD